MSQQAVVLLFDFLISSVSDPWRWCTLSAVRLLEVKYNRNHPVSEETEITFSRRIDRVADEFEAAWKKGLSPSIRKFLEGYSQNQQHELLRELILIDLAYRHRAGETLDLDDYLKQFPERSNPGRCR